MTQDDDDLPAGIRAALHGGRVVDDRRQEERRQPDDDLGIKIRWSIVVQAIAWAVGMFVLYNTMTSRLTALETNRQNDTQRMERIESKIDRLIEQKK